MLREKKFLYTYFELRMAYKWYNIVGQYANFAISKILTVWCLDIVGQNATVKVG